METFVDIGAAGRFADGVQVALPQTCFQLVNGFEMRPAFAQPFRESGLRKGLRSRTERIYLYKGVQEDYSSIVIIDCDPLIFPLPQLAD